MDRPLLTPLGPGDEAELARFLDAHADSSVFLRANLRTHGLVDGGERLHGTYAAARAGGALVAVAAHYRSGNVMLQGRVDVVGDVARAAVARSGREVGGLHGPRAQVVAARIALGFADRPATLDSREDLLALALADLRLPPPLADGRWRMRHPVDGDGPLLGRWARAYRVEALGAPPEDEPTDEELAHFRASPSLWLLEVDGAVAAQCAYTAALDDVVQIGGVYTPPPLRNRGYGRAVVAGALADARARGVSRGVLFTENPAARAAYVAIGFGVVGDYAIVSFA